MENGQTQVEAPAEVTQWPLPAGAKNALQKLVDEQRQLLLSIGSLEAEYHDRKERLLVDLNGKKQRWQTTLDAAARAGGLDIDNSKWLLDSKHETLVKQP